MVMTALVVNLRFAMYSASIAPHLKGVPLPMRLLLAYLLTDQAYAVSLVRFLEAKEMTPPSRVWFYSGTAVALWVVWQAATVIGYFLGALVPKDWSLDFAVPLTFGALLISAVRNRADALAAAVGGTVALAAAGLPYNLGLVLGAALGIVSGVLFGLLVAPGTAGDSGGETS
jgi:predicted branched-subunit amino acid permease